MRLSLLLASLVHWAALPLLSFLSFHPAGRVLVPVLLAIGIGLLWAPTLLVAGLAMLHALVALCFLGIAATQWGDRHGADLFIAGASLPSLVLAVLLGNAWRKLATLGPGPNPRAADPASDRRSSWPGRLALGTATLGLVGWIGLELRKAYWEGLPPSVPKPLAVPGSPRIEPAVVPTIATAASGDGLVDRFSEEDLQAFLARLDSERVTVWDSNLYRGARYLGTYTYSDIPPGFDGKAVPFTCRTELLRRLAPLWLGHEVGDDAPPFLRAGNFGLDTLFRSLACAEFPDFARFHLARRDTAASMAVWSPVTPAYRIRVGLRRLSSGEVSAHLAFALHPAEAPDDPAHPFEGSHDPWRFDLFLVPQQVAPSGAFEYSTLTFSRDPFTTLAGEPGPREVEMQAESSLTLELGGFRHGSLERVWVELTFEAGRTRDDGFRWHAARAELKCRYRAGPEISLATSIRRPPLEPEDAAIFHVDLTDADGDGHPDFLVRGVHLPDQLIFTGPEGRRAVVLLRPFLWRLRDC